MTVTKETIEMESIQYHAQRDLTSDFEGVDENKDDNSNIQSKKVSQSHAAAAEREPAVATENGNSTGQEKNERDDLFSRPREQIIMDEILRSRDGLIWNQCEVQSTSQLALVKEKRRHHKERLVRVDHNKVNDGTKEDDAQRNEYPNIGDDGQADQSQPPIDKPLINASNVNFNKTFTCATSRETQFLRGPFLGPTTISLSSSTWEVNVADLLGNAEFLDPVFMDYLRSNDRLLHKRAVEYDEIKPTAASDRKDEKDKEDKEQKEHISDCFIPAPKPCENEAADQKHVLKRNICPDKKQGSKDFADKPSGQRRQRLHKSDQDGDGSSDEESSDEEQFLRNYIDGHRFTRGLPPRKSKK